MSKLSIVVPCYNEAESLPIFFQETQNVVLKMPVSVEYIFVDDGSKDHTYQVMQQLAKKYPEYVTYISFSRNFGKEAAIYAGLSSAKGDYITLMDADLQDPPQLLPEMLRLIQEEGYDCVGTKRVDRTGEPPIRSFFAKTFYKLMNKISDVPLVDGARDFRLMTRPVVDAVLSLKEYNRFAKSIFSWVGFKTIYLPYENQERVAGTTSWSFMNLFHYSLEAIINFSEVPLIIASFLGIISCLLAIIWLIFIVIRTLIFGDPTSGWPSMVSIVLFIGGLQLFSLGVIGKYIGKIFLETKKRPLYIIKEYHEHKTHNEDTRATD